MTESSSKVRNRSPIAGASPPGQSESTERISEQGSQPGEVTGEVTGEVGRTLSVLTEERSRLQLQQTLGLSSEENFRQRYLLPALNAGLIEMTIPDKPNSRLQKYRLTDKGRAWLAVQAKGEQNTD